MSGRYLLLALAMLPACGGEIAGSDEPTADAGAECGIHETIEWPTYFAGEGAEFDLPVGDAGLVEVCSRIEAGPFYLCAPPVLR